MREWERWKACRVNPTLSLMLSPNYGTRACKKWRRTRTVPSLRGKSSEIMFGNYPWIISGNYHWELWERWKARRVKPTLRLMVSSNYGTRACKKGRGTRTVHSFRGFTSENYHLVYHDAEKLRFIGILAYPKTLTVLINVNYT